VKKLFFLIAVASLMAACADSTTAPTAQKKLAAPQPLYDFTCRSGYTIAYDENGNPYCVPDQSGTLRRTGTP
jgi:hypothetical protein